jgi:hypothetical protein
MLNYVALHYSPVIIANEFASLRQPDAMATLTEEGLNVKIVQGGGATVAGASSSEVIAGYVVDEQPMEIGIRLPAEFPLKGVQIRDLRRAGVPENKWRGWLMSVQQTITSRVSKISYLFDQGLMTEWIDLGSINSIQKESITSFRRSRRMFNLLLVRFSYIQISR